MKREAQIEAKRKQVTDAQNEWETSAETGDLAIYQMRKRELEELLLEDEQEL